MGDSTPNAPGPFGNEGHFPPAPPGPVVSMVGEKVLTIIAEDGGDNTIRPAPDYLRRVLRHYALRMRPPEKGDETQS
jgi:hypothetical protein